jgi:ribonucleotide reductase beta subunit family protein with ferritin-like domain
MDNNKVISDTNDQPIIQNIFNHDKDEPILDPVNSRFTIEPILYPDIWNSYKAQQNCYWRAEEIDFSKDYDDYCKLSSDEQHFIDMILAFFAASDGIVNFNIRERFLNEIQIIEALTAYSWQMMMENIHNEVYSKMLMNIVKDSARRDKLFNAIKTVKSVKLMADWAFKWIASSASFAHRLVAFAIVEGIFFSGAFAAIFWLKKYRSKGEHFLNGLIKSNEFISRDEGEHARFAVLLYSHLKFKLPKDDIYNILKEAVEISKQFNDDAIPCRLIGMNNELMNQYIEYIADRLLLLLNYPKLYNATNPFEFMETIGLNKKTNFFEHRPTDYQSANNSDNVLIKKIVELENF